MTPLTHADDTVYPVANGQPGLTKREYFASQALTGMLTNLRMRQDLSLLEATQWAVDYADQLIATLNAEGK